MEIILDQALHIIKYTTSLAVELTAHCNVEVH